LARGWLYPQSMKTGSSSSELSARVVSGANWCFWIAGMTAVNTALLLSGSDSSFAIGTVAGQVAAYFAAKSGATGISVAIGFNLVIIAYFIAAGLFARRGHRWAFVVAFVGYGLDSALLVFVPMLMSIIFHGWALFSLVSGWVAAGKLPKALAVEAELLAPFPPPMPSPVAVLPPPDSAGAQPPLLQSPASETPPSPSA
jgi:hypothetical protein